MGFGLQRFDLSELTRKLELTEISADPAKPITLFVRHAGEGNAAWANTLFKLRPPADKETTPEAQDAAGDAPEAAKLPLADIFAESVIAGWENVYENGAEVAFSVEAAKRFLDELVARCPDVWMRLFVFARRDIAEWRRPTVDRVDLGKG